MAIYEGTMDLEWFGPYNWSDVYAEPMVKLPGLYLWTRDALPGRIAAYLGETGKTISSRLKSHAAMYRTGEFGLRDWEAFDRMENAYLKPSYYRKYHPAAKQEFRDRADYWKPIVEEMISSKSIFLLPIPHWIGREHRPIRMRLEKAIGNDILKSWPLGYPNLFEGYDEYVMQRQENPLKARFLGSLPLENMSHFLEF